MVKLIIFTDLDGTLLNQEDYDYQPAIPVLNQLTKQKIPVIPVTSKTRSEVEGLRQQIGLRNPFIVENGSGIFIPNDEELFQTADLTLRQNYYVKTLGRDYPAARAGLKAVAQVLGENLRGFGDLSEAEVRSLTQLPPEEVKQAKQREFTEPFITPKQVSSQAIEVAANQFGFRVLVGDRFSHLIALKAGKGKAVQWLMENYQLSESAEKVITVGLGNSPNDLEMLEAVDIPIVIASRRGVHPGLVAKGWKIPDSPGSQGWAEAVSTICTQYL